MGRMIVGAWCAGDPALVLRGALGLLANAG